MRFTNEWPPVQLQREFPNWEYALDEENVEGQDETTLRPSEQQAAVGSDTEITAGSVRLADGTDHAALIHLHYGSPQEVVVFPGQGEPWSVVLMGERPKSWRAFGVDLADKAIFPLHLQSHLPRESTGRPITLRIGNDGFHERAG